MTRTPDIEKVLTFSSFGDTENSGSAFVSTSLAAEVAVQFGPRNESSLSVFAYDGDVLVGGINGVTHWGWCYIRHLWVHESRRSQGIGRGLLAQAEAQAHARECVGLYVDTFDSGAVKFYESCGFSRAGRIDGFPPGHARTFLSKALSSE